MGWQMRSREGAKGVWRWLAPRRGRALVVPEAQVAKRVASGTPRPGLCRMAIPSRSLRCLSQHPALLHTTVSIVFPQLCRGGVRHVRARLLALARLRPVCCWFWRGRQRRVCTAVRCGPYAAGMERTGRPAADGHGAARVAAAGAIGRHHRKWRVDRCCRCLDSAWNTTHHLGGEGEGRSEVPGVV